ncbi:MAG: SDR family oxidoreductase [Nanoarchaeota archaeon]
MKKDLFSLKGKTILITGGGGLLGPKHAEAIIEYGGTVILTDYHEDKVIQKSKELNDKYGEGKCIPHYMDVTNKKSIKDVVDQYDKIDILINNAAKDPKVKKGNEGLTPESRFETMTEEYWYNGIGAIITGTFLCSQVLCNKFLEQGHGNIINISSDLGIIAPDQRLYLKDGVNENKQNVKPITYSAAKWAIIGMTKYLGSYYGNKNIKVNCICPSAIQTEDHSQEFVDKISKLIPKGRMCHIDELKSTIVYLCSDSSSYLQGSVITVDGGKTIW